MKIEGGLFTGGALFYFIITGIYAYVAGDVIGTTALLMTGGLSIIIGSYLLFTGKRVGLRPEDRFDAEISEADSEYGFFSPHSWWPLPVAAGAAITFTGLAFATWIIVIGLTILMVSIFGWLFEYHRGDFTE